MATVCLFNPEHDLCLANGSPHYVAPASALLFAQQRAWLMHLLCPDAAACLPAEAVTPEMAGEWNAEEVRIVPWGWNAVVRQQLVRCGVEPSRLPSDDELRRWRQLQHRAMLLPLQTDCCAVTTPQEAEERLAGQGGGVMKEPWSGSGRGLRWAAERLTEQDRRWLEKVVRRQGCVLVEPRRQVEEEFAVEYEVGQQKLTFVGFSLFATANGVYRYNLLLPDEAIRRRVGYTAEEQAGLETWLCDTLVGRYVGPLGVDYMHTTDGRNHVGEMNLRHTMGMVAHQYLRLHPEAEGTQFNPMEVNLEGEGTTDGGKGAACGGLPNGE